MNPKCGAKTKAGTPCKLTAGHGTDHVGAGKCKLHGGASDGAPEGNQNAVKHGAYSAIIRERLSPDEQEVFDRIPTTSDLEGELRINRFKLLRLLEDVEQNFQMGFTVRKIEADELTKIKGIVKLTDSIRKLTKDMQGTDVDDPLVEFLELMDEAREARQQRRQSTEE